MNEKIWYLSRGPKNAECNYNKGKATLAIEAADDRNYLFHYTSIEALMLPVEIYYEDG